MPGASALAAVSFLTRVPVRRAFSPGEVARSAVFFPFVGAGVGAAGAGVAWLAGLGLSPLLSAALSVAAVALVTGALHLDGLADTADAAGGSTRERRLEIMRDSRIGTFGAVAVALDLLIKTAAVEQLLLGHALVALVAAGAASRAAAVLLARWLPYARAQGTGGVLGRPSGLAVVAAALIALPVVPAVVLLGLAYRRWLGGVTGDSLGAAIELTETLALVVAAAFA